MKWEDQESVPQWSIPSQSGGNKRPEFTPNDYSILDGITSGSGLWLVRYRNVKTGTCNIISPYPNGFAGATWGNAGSWVTEVYQY